MMPDPEESQTSYNSYRSDHRPERRPRAEYQYEVPDDVGYDGPVTPVPPPPPTQRTPKQSHRKRRASNARKARRLNRRKK